MPLRDHFRRPLPSSNRWTALHGGWPMTMAADLNEKLPARYTAQPRLYLGSNFEIDVATEERHRAGGAGADPADGGGVATAVLAPPEPTLVVAADLSEIDAYEVLVHDDGGRLVAAVEIVSPANKDRPAMRRAFVAKCASMIAENVCVAIVDLVSTRRANLFGQLLEFFEVTEPALGEPPSALYAVACRRRRRESTGILEAWPHALELGRALPTLPLWLDEDSWVPLDLESTYEETCRKLRME